TPNPCASPAPRPSRAASPTSPTSPSETPNGPPTAPAARHAREALSPRAGTRESALRAAGGHRADHSDEDAATTFIAQVLKIPALVAQHHDSASRPALTASRADLLKTPAQAWPRSFRAADISYRHPA